jgi:hypothetical protein
VTPPRPPGWVIVVLSVGTAAAVIVWTLIGLGVLAVLSDLSSSLQAVLDGATCEVVPPVPPNGGG